MKIQTIKKMCAIIIICSSILLSGCGDEKSSWQPVNDGVIKIAVLGQEEYIVDNGAMEAMEMASEDFYEKTGVRIETVVYDDDADYNKGLMCAGKIAEDDSIGAVLVKQELDYIDATAEIFDAAGKAFILTNGCYERTINQGYEYMLVDCINARLAGSIMADYIENNGYKRVAFCHSDTEYEEDELKGLQKRLNDSESVLADTVVGPYTQEEFDIVYQRWLNLGIDIVCISNYDIYNSDLIKMLREKGSDIPVVGDYVMDTDEEIAANGKYLDGTAIVSMYINDNEMNNEQIKKRYEEKYGMEMSEKAIQSYDITYMLGMGLNSGISKSHELIDYMKNSEGYQGISGILKFDENGCLIPDGNEMLIFKNGMFEKQ